MRTYTTPDLSNPSVAQKKPGSMFTPAIAAWSSPGAMGALPANLPSWTGYAVAAALLALAALRKIPWWAAIAGSAGVVWYLNAQGNMVANLTSGSGISANGSTYYFSVNTPGLLVTAPGGVQSVQIGSQTFPLLSTQSNSDGSTTYYLDNPQ